MDAVQSFLMIPDSVSDRILLFDPINGSLIDNNFIDGSSDTGLGIFQTPLNAIQVNQEIWVSDQLADALFRFDLQGEYIGVVGDADGDGDTDGLDNIRGIEFINGQIYVANGGDDNDVPGDGEVVVVFDPSGNNLGFFDTGDPYDIRAFNGELLISDINRDSDGGEDIDRYSIDGVNSAQLGTFHESDGETGVDFPQQITVRDSSGTVLVGGFSAPGGIYEYDVTGMQVGFLGADEGFANRLRAAYELGNGNIIWSGGDGVIVTNPETGVDTDVTYTVDNLDFRPSARYIEPLVILPEGDRDLTGAIYVADQTLDALYLTQDLNGDGDANDLLESSVFFDGTNASDLADPTSNIFTVLQAKDGSVLYGDGGSDSVYRLTDANGDGDALDAGEASVWFSADNAGGLPLLTPNGLAEGPEGAIYITEADTRSTPNGDFIYRTEDLNGDGDANDANEASVWLDLKAVNPNSSAFEISFIGDTAYIIDSVGGDTNVIYRAKDADGSGQVETDEVSILVDETVVPVDFGLTTDGQSLYTVELLDFEGPQSVFKIEDGETVTTTEVWNSSAVPEGFSLFAAFSIAAGPNGELAVTSNGGDANEDNVFRLVDTNGDGDYLDAGETIPYLSRLLTSTVPVRPRVVEYAQAPAGTDFDQVGTNGADRLFGDDGNNAIDGRGGNDTIFGRGGNDFLVGGDGDDRLFALEGDDTLIGGNGDDKIFGREGNDTIDGGDGNDRLFADAGDDVITSGPGNDRIFSGRGNDIATGGDGNNKIFGAQGSDIIFGKGGNDRLFGGDDRDVIVGGDGNDVMFGDDGNDVLLGGLGRDVLNGGAGADLFVLGTGDELDVIRDFEAGIDKIGLIDGELTFADLTIVERNGKTFLGAAESGATLAILRNVSADALGESSFETVSAVTTVEEAMALI